MDLKLGQPTITGRQRVIFCIHSSTYSFTRLHSASYIRFVMIPSPSSAEDEQVKNFRDLQTSHSCSNKLILCLAVLASAIFLLSVLILLGKGVIGSRSDSALTMDYELFGPYSYVVNTPNCRIPSYHPYREDVQSFNDSRKYSFDEKPGSCGSLPLLSRISRSGETHTLHLNKQYMSNYTTTPHEAVTCCYSYIHRTAVLTQEPTFGACQKFDDSVTLDPDFDFVRVTCGNDTPSNIYHHFHSYVGIKRGVKVKIEDKPRSGPKPWSVMIIGIDSLSRLNLMRTMPITSTYLENSWFSLEGYNKVGEDTFSNLAAAVLAGSTEEQLRRTCIPKDNSFVDWCPWIFRKYSDQGYITGYGEDITKDDTFYLKTGGFKRRPTNYYLRTSLKAAEASMNSTQFDCIGKTYSAKHVLDFSLEFAEVLKNHPTFSLFWINSFSHDKMFGPKEMDEHFQTYLDKLTKSQDHTVLIFMSDSGIAHGFYDPHMSFIDTNLPFLFIWLPESFINLNPNATINLIENRGKLTSHFDLHMTLLDLLEDTSKAPGCPTCTSLFKTIPTERTCSDAGIPPRNCACTEYSEVANTSSMHSDLGEFLVSKLNEILGQLQKDVLDHKYKCDNFSLARIISVQRVLPKADDSAADVGQIEIEAQPTGNGTYQFFIISVETRPKALMDAVVLYKNKSMQIIDSVLRPDTKEPGTRCMKYLTHVVEDVKSAFT